MAPSPNMAWDLCSLWGAGNALKDWIQQFIFEPSFLMHMIDSPSIKLHIDKFNQRHSVLSKHVDEPLPSDMFPVLLLSMCGLTGCQISFRAVQLSSRQNKATALHSHIHSAT